MPVVSSKPVSSHMVPPWSRCTPREVNRKLLSVIWGAGDPGQNLNKQTKTKFPTMSRASPIFDGALHGNVVHCPRGLSTVHVQVDVLMAQHIVISQTHFARESEWSPGGVLVPVRTIKNSVSCSFIWVTNVWKSITWEFSTKEFVAFSTQIWHKMAASQAVARF